MRQAPRSPQSPLSKDGAGAFFNETASTRKRSVSVSSAASAELVLNDHDLDAVEQEITAAQNRNNLKQNEQIPSSTEKIIQKLIRPRSNSQPMRFEDGDPTKRRHLGSNTSNGSTSSSIASKLNQTPSDAPTRRSRTVDSAQADVLTKRASKINDTGDYTITFSRMSQGPTFFQQARPGSIIESGTKEISLTDPSFHHVGTDEIGNYAEWINATLEPHLDPELAYLFPDGLPLPIEGPDAKAKFFNSIKDGVLLAKLIHATSPNAIDMSHIRRNPKVRAHALENNIAVIEASKKMGVKLNNVGPEDILNATTYLCSGLVSQVIKVGVLSKISLFNNPDLASLLTDTDDASKITNETLLMKWVNFHLTAAQSPLRIKNFTSDLSTAEVLATLIRQLVSHGDEHEGAISHIYDAFSAQKDPRRKAEYVLHMAALLGCKRVLTVEDIIRGNKDHMLTFLGQLLVKYPNLEEALGQQAKDMKNASKENLAQQRQESNVIISRLNDQVEGLKKETAGLQKEIAAKSSEYSKVEAGFQAKSKEVETFKFEFDEMQKKLSAADVKNKELSLQNGSLQTSAASMKQNVESLQSEIERLKKMLATLNEEKLSLLQQISAMQNQLLTVSSSATEKDLAAQRLQFEVESWNRSKNELKEQIERLTKQKSDLESVLIHVNTKIETVTSENNEKFGSSISTFDNDIRKNVEALIAAFRSTRQQLATEQEFVVALRKQLQEMKELNATKVDTAIQKYQKEVSEYKESIIPGLEKEVLRLVTELEAKEDLISEQRATVERLRQNQEQLRDIDKSLLQAREQNANYEKMIADLKQQLLNKDKEAQKWTETSKSLRQDFMNQARDEKSEFKRVHQESDDLLAKLKALKADMERNRTGTREVRSEFSGRISQKLEYFASVSARLDKMLETVK